MSVPHLEDHPFAWACVRLKEHMEEVGVVEGPLAAKLGDVPVAWGIVLGRIAAYSDMIRIADAAFALAAQAEGVPEDKMGMILKTRVDLARMREEVDLALQSAGASRSLT